MPKEKIGMGMLDRIREKTKQKSENAESVQTLNDDLLHQYIQQYAEDLSKNGRDLVKTQLSQCKFEVEDDDRIKCTTFMHLQFNTLNSIRVDLTNYFINHLHNPRLKIRILLDEQEQINAGDKVLTKNEIFEQMANRFPILQTLKDELQLTVKAKYTYQRPEPKEKEGTTEPAIAKLDENTDTILDESISLEEDE